jgi:hypothetical protein
MCAFRTKEMTTTTSGKPDRETEIKMIRQRLTSSADDLDRFNKLMRHCTSDKDKDLLLVSYRHLLPELYDQQLHGAQIHPLLKRPIIIGYLLNEDIVGLNVSFSFEPFQLVPSAIASQGILQRFGHGPHGLSTQRR